MGVDDGAFDRHDREAPIAAVVVALPSGVEEVRVGRVRVDGTDGTRRIVALLRRLADRAGVRAVLLDGAVVGGFNVLDLDTIARATGVPVVAVTRRPPDFVAIRAALREWFPRSAAERYRLLRRHRLFRVPTRGLPIWAAAAGCPAADAARLIARATVRGFWPEPLRLAHLVASAGRSGRRHSDRTVKEPRRRSAGGPVA